MPTKNASGKSYSIGGIATPTGENSLDIVELPVRTWTQPYKEFLEGLLKAAPAPARANAAAAAAAGRRRLHDCILDSDVA